MLTINVFFKRVTILKRLADKDTFDIPLWYILMFRSVIIFVQPFPKFSCSMLMFRRVNCEISDIKTSCIPWRCLHHVYVEKRCQRCVAANIETFYAFCGNTNQCSS